MWLGFKSSVNKGELWRERCFEFLILRVFGVKRVFWRRFELDFRRERLEEVEEREGNIRVGIFSLVGV